jgi:hypothetical protein
VSPPQASGPHKGGPVASPLKTVGAAYLAGPTARASELGIVREYRSAARRILRDDSLGDHRASALRRLYRRAKDEAGAALIIGAIVAEIGWSIDKRCVLAESGTGERLERLHRGLRGLGYELCPECEQRLSGEVDWSRWRQLRAAAITELEAREGASA